MKGKHKSIRAIISIVLIAAIILGFIATLFDIQINNHTYYAAQNNTVKSYKVSIDAARGEIVDRNGNSLVTNKQGNSIILDAAYFPSTENNQLRNDIILNLIQLFEKNEEEYTMNLPLEIAGNDKIRFTDDLDEIEIMKSVDMLNMQTYATAQNCFVAMVEKYELENFDIKTALKIGNIRYELTRLLFSIRNPVTIASDVKDETVAAIKEDQVKYLGANVQVVSYREYTDSTLAPHILGTVRNINAEEYERKKEDGYNITDQIGESGIEFALEKELRGIPGEKTITIDSNGNVTEEVTKLPVQGNTIVLTIDRDMQKLSQDKLKKVCNEVNASSSAGAVVVEDVNNGEVLAAASYPTYDLSDYYDKYKQLAGNPRKPLWSRFAMGAYAPGSTFKPMIACAALEEGAVNNSTTFFCDRKFKYYDHTFGCPRYHGSENIKTALRDSCNIYFYNCAKILGITKMNEYGSAFGLGEKTGVEISEASGILAGPEYREGAGGYWQAGDAIQAAIGQSDNLFTPLQLCNYNATLANGGTRYEMHFVKAIINSSTGIVNESGATVAETIELSNSTLNSVQEGMRMVATNGGPASIFNKLDTKVACKTGTSTVYVNGVKRNNGFLITYAPYKNPEISISSVVELAGSGTSTAEITASIVDYWYTNNTDETKSQQTGTLL